VDYLLFPSILCSWWARCNGPTLWHIRVLDFLEHMVGHHVILLWYDTWHGRWILVYALSLSFFDVEPEAYMLQIRYLIN
jgi:hypothetical protein